MATSLNKAPQQQTGLITCRPKTVLAHILLPALFLVLGLCVAPHKARAFCYYSCPLDVELETNQQSAQNMKDHDKEQHEKTRDNINEHTDKDFEDHEKWMIDTVWTQWLLPNWGKMTEQISAVAIWQMQAIGMMLDAKHQLETQRLFQQLSAVAYKDYTPSEGLCTIASMSRSLGGTDRNVDATSLILSARSMARALLKKNSSSTEGDVTDRASRFAQFQLRYCDSSDNTNGLQAVCQHDAAVPNTTMNKDIDFYRTLGAPTNLNMNLVATANPDLTDDETDVLALQSNLYAHQVPDTFQVGNLKGDADTADMAIQKYLDMRAIAAKRSVAENSFNEIAAMKAVGPLPAGQPNVAISAAYLRAALVEMGITVADATKMIGDNPSYFAQMDLLTRRMFQRPEFFVDLYDKPANVERKGVALQAISVMQRRDIFKSQLRTEAMMSLLLELDVAREQSAFENAQ